MTQDEKLEMLNHLRIAEKVLESLHQMGESRSALNNQSVIYYSIRAKAAVQAARRFAERVEASVPPDSSLPPSH